MYIYYISLIPVICNRKLAKKNWSFHFAHKFSVHRTEERWNNLLVLVFYAHRIEMSLTISVAISFLSAFFLPSFLNTINTISTKNVECDSDGSIPRS